MFGKRFCPRIRGLHRQWLYRLDPQREYGPLTALLSPQKRTIHLDWITPHWDRMGQFFAPCAAGHMTASVALKRLLACGPRHHFYRAVRELGRVDKTIVTLDYHTDPALRRRVRRGVLQGEPLHALARHVHYGRRGHADGRDFQQPMSRASCLVLILAAIIYWQIREIDTVLHHWDPVEDGVDASLLPHMSPIGWDNIVLYGEYALDRSLVSRRPSRLAAFDVENSALSPHIVLHWLGFSLSVHFCTRLPATLTAMNVMGHSFLREATKMRPSATLISVHLHF
jgi:hypothetical protein